MGQNMFIPMPCLTNRSSTEDEDDSDDEYIISASEEDEEDEDEDDLSLEDDIRFGSCYRIACKEDPVDVALYNCILMDIMRRHEAEERRKKREALNCPWPTGRSTLHRANALMRRAHGQASRAALLRHAERQRQVAKKHRRRLARVSCDAKAQGDAVVAALAEATLLATPGGGGGATAKTTLQRRSPRPRKP